VATKQELKEKFQQKNLLRKLGRENGSVSRRKEARQMRKSYDGAFGRLKNSDWNDLIIGTTGEMRRSG
jgi:hypothetical protein